MKTGISRYIFNPRWRAAALVLLVGLSACNKVVDLQPKDRISQDQAFSTPSLIELSAVGMYDAAQSQPGGYNGSGDPRGYPFAAAAIEMGEMRGTDMLNKGSFYAIVNGNTVTPLSPNVQGMWSGCYALINICNNVIQGVQNAAQNGVVSADVANGYIGEARFLRALAHHELLIHFAKPYLDNPTVSLGVPYRDYAINSPEGVAQAEQQPRNTVAECYAKILDDLTFAEQNLPVSRQGNKNVTRATQGAAIALKVRILQHMNNWTDCITEANKIISPTAPFTSPINNYALTAKPDAPFLNHGQNLTSESIFSIENNVQDAPSVNGALAQMLGAPMFQGRGVVAISPTIYNASFFPGSDLRRTMMVNDTSAHYYYTTKYNDYQGFSDWTPIIRYSEVLLNLAEAIVRNSNNVDQRAVELLNAVRNRSVTDPAYQYTLASFNTASDLLQAILNERRIELMAEGFNWPDYHRQGLTVPAKSKGQDISISDYNYITPPVSLTTSIDPVTPNSTQYLWPIPQPELANNPALAAPGQQNPGY